MAYCSIECSPYGLLYGKQKRKDDFKRAVLEKIDTRDPNRTKRRSGPKHRKRLPSNIERAKLESELRIAEILRKK